MRHLVLCLVFGGLCAALEPIQYTKISKPRPRENSMSACEGRKLSADGNDLEQLNTWRLDRM